MTAPYIAFAGTIEPRKNIPGLIGAFGRIAPEHAGLQLVIAGGGGWGGDAVTNAIAASGVENRIVRTGYLADELVPPLFRRAAVVAYPSFEEGFGLPALEALACGAPLVTTRGSSIEEFVGDAAVFAVGRTGGARRRARVCPGPENAVGVASPGAAPSRAVHVAGISRRARRCLPGRTATGAEDVTLRVALGVEQLLDDAPGGIGRYIAELATRLPDHGVEVVGFTARHPRRRVDRALRAYGLDSVEPVILALPRPLLYDAWHVARAFGPVPRVGAGGSRARPVVRGATDARVPLVGHRARCRAPDHARDVHATRTAVSRARFRGGCAPGRRRDHGLRVQRRRDRHAHRDRARSHPRGAERCRPGARDAEGGAALASHLRAR